LRNVPIVPMVRVELIIGLSSGSISELGRIFVLPERV
jgi:hypothetical protein